MRCMTWRMARTGEADWESSLAKSRTMTSESFSVMNAQPWSWSSSRIWSLFTMSPLWPSAMDPCAEETHTGCAFSRREEPVVE